MNIIYTDNEVLPNVFIMDPFNAFELYIYM